jgi:hypothetical protein
MRQLVDRVARWLGRPIRVAVVPRLLMNALGSAVPLVREMNEMLYQWDEPFVVDDRRFRERFRMDPTPAGRAAQATIGWAKEAYGLNAG